MKGKNVIIIFIGIIISFFTLLFIVDFAFFQTESKQDLIFTASREGSLGGIWLGLYDDKHFELGSSQGDANTIGTYLLVNDTLKLVVRKGNIKLGNNGSISFVIEDGMLIETSKPGRIKFLGIIKNELNNSFH